MTATGRRRGRVVVRLLRLLRLLLNLVHFRGGQLLRRLLICLDDVGMGRGRGGEGLSVRFELAHDGVWELVEAAPFRDAD